MNRKTLCKQFNILIVLALLLAGCSRAGVSDSQTTSVPGGTDLPQPTETLEKTIILPTAVHPTQTAPAPEPSATPIPLSEFPDIVMNYGDHITCFFEQRNEILVFSFPYREAKLILADPEMDYYLPTWSPDGEWIAYVESRPNIIREGTDDKPGDASIWIMRPDGSERHRVSEYVTDAYFHWVGGDFCDHVSFISAPLAWSKDGRYLAFSHRDYTFRPLSIVYIVDVISGETKLIEAQAEYTSLSWMPDKNNLIMKGDQKEVIIFKVDGLDNIERTSIPNRKKFFLMKNFII